MGQICKFDEKRDIKRVVSGLAVNLTDALRTGIVQDGTSTSDYNAIDDPSQIVGRVESVFDAIDAQRAVKKYGKNVDASKVVTPPAAPPAAPAE